ncbi:GIY-YIG nuclease family protein [Streptomyces sp. NPDC056291]|uniref:GIY-YIG nuclease family protein n=1 Tax=Streptomyces sp. NPDC056291 TaxID=3345772 RepID=UPI0035E05CA7
MREATPQCVATDGGQACLDIVTSTIPAPLCRRHRMEIALAIVPEMLRAAAGPDIQQPRELPPAQQALIDDAVRAPLRLDAHHPACVYLVARGDRVKIGFSTHLGQRLDTLHAEASDVLLLLAGGRKLEGALHERYANFRVGNTEWFTRARCLEGFVQEARRRPLAAAAPPVTGTAPVHTLVRYPVDVAPEELREVAARAYRPGERGVHLSEIVAEFRARGVPALWSLADLGRAYEAAGVTVRAGVRVGGRVSIGIHVNDLPALEFSNAVGA